MRFVPGLLLVAATSGSVACAKDGIRGDDGPDAGPDAAAGGPDADVGPQPCDMTGIWIAEQHTTSTALGSDQNTTTWYFYQFSQTGDRFTAVKSLNCGLVVDGTTTVTLDDATLEALAPNEAAGPGRGGTFKPTADGQQCEFSLDRMYNLRGANKAMYLTSAWTVGAPDKPLAMFPALPTNPPGMEDWDHDNMHGITLRSGLGNRFVAQRDYNQHAGTVAQFADQFGGRGVVVVKWDSQEGISDQTGPLLRVTATPKGDGWARYARADERLTVVETGAHPALETCRNVQRLAREIWP
ncbi:MAG TPA: hypothetical protein VM734_09310 [Kofleriaceae bacterium]|jgi:hypothetical protein|nr:hypothetical protein [Kofleriaceae bacterium]